jgi:NifB/MoaA-like Fe-S oxidoreductase
VERGITWAFGADELYLRAGLELPPAATYDGFEQVENGVGSVRWLEERIAEGLTQLADWRGRRIGVLTGRSMAGLLPQVLDPLARVTGASYELMPLGNPLFGDAVTCAGLLPGAAFRQALAERRDLDLALIPGESLNQDHLFMDDLTLQTLRSEVPMEVRPSYHFTDALDTPPAL